MASRFRIRSVRGHVFQVDAVPIKRRRSLGSPFFFRSVGRGTVFDAMGPVRQVMSHRSHFCSNYLGDHLGEKGVGFAWYAFQSFHACPVAIGFLIVDNGIFCYDGRSSLLSDLCGEGCRF